MASVQNVPVKIVNNGGKRALTIGMESKSVDSVNATLKKIDTVKHEKNRKPTLYKSQSVETTQETTVRIKNLYNESKKLKK